MSVSTASAADLDYARDVAPIFRTYCAGCHNERDLEGGLSLETYGALREGGDRGDPVKPGDAEESFLIQAIEGRKRPHMPPKGETPLPASARETLRRWVSEGARGPAKDVSILESFVAPEVPPFEGYAPVTSLALAPGGDLIAVGRFGAVEIRDARTYALEATIAGFRGKVNAVAFSRDGERLIAATGIAGLTGEARLLELGSEKGIPAGAEQALRVFGGHRDILYDAVLAPDGSFVASAGYDRVVRIARLESGELLHAIDVHQGAVFDLELDPSGRVLASASANETVKLWRVSDGVRLDTLNQPQGEQFAVAFTPDGEHILSAGADRRIHVWRFVSKEEPALNPVVDSRFAHDATIVALRVLVDGTRVVSAAEDGTLKVWSFPALEQIASYETQPDVVSEIVDARDGESFLVARLDGTIERYALPARDLASSGSGESKAADELVSAQGTFALGTPAEHAESKANDAPADAEPVSLPVEIRGAIERPGDVDLFRFSARAGMELALEVDAARSGARLDSKIEVLDPDGNPIEQVTLRAVRDSWFTFRGKDSSTSDDFRLHNWREMELDEFLYANGEVVRLWLYPRGPDSGFKVYPGSGLRQPCFATTALSHALGASCYIVEPLPPGSDPPPNGLPVFRLHYENDDDSYRRLGSDSFLIFRAPRDGEYIARISDVRGFGGESEFGYRLSIRAPRPSFTVAVAGKGAKVSPGSGRELHFSATRLEGFEGPIRIDIENLPEGFHATTPVVIEEGQIRAFGVLSAAAGAKEPSKEALAAVKVTARAEIRGTEVTQDLGDLGALGLGGPPKLTIEILPVEGNDSVTRDEHGRFVFEIRPGGRIEARVRATRHDFAARIELGGDDSGRNLPHGVFVDDIGLNGLLIVEGETERDFFITAAPIVKPCTRLFHLRATADGGQCSAPAVIRVVGE